MTAMRTSEVAITLPTGGLSLLGDGTASAFLRVSMRNREAALASLESLSALDARRFWLPSSIKQSAEGLCLAYAKPVHEVTPLPQVAQQWREDPALHLVPTLALVGQLLQARGELEQLGPQRFHLSPAQVFSARDEAGKVDWLVLPLPTEWAAFADFIRADEDCWAWLSADELLGAIRSDRTYTMGAAMYYCLIAELFPREFSRNERIRRALLYRGGTPALARQVLTNALPKSRESTANQLSDFIMGLLGPSLGRSLTLTHASRELKRFQDELSAYHLACQWELAGPAYSSRARKILEAYAASVPDNEVPWETLERLRRKDGDPVGAANAARRYQSRETSSLISHVRGLIESGDEGKPELRRLLSTLRQGGGPDQQGQAAMQELSEAESLYLAYAHGCKLERPEEALFWLRRDFSVSWHKVMYSILLSRLLADQADWREVLLNCREGRRLISKMPDTGGLMGRYANAYVDLLDGIAHASAVHRQSYSETYLNDAFDRLGSAWMNLQAAEATDLGGAIVSWLAWLSELARRNPRLTTLGLAVEAFLNSLGQISIQPPRADSPPIPWFDETRLFTA